MTKIEIEKQISAIKKEIEDVSSNKRISEARMAKLTATVRTRGGKLPTDEYKNICREQTKIRYDIIKYENEIRPLKQEIRRLSVLKQEIEEATKTAVSDIDYVMNSLMELKRYYTDFSIDSTRVSSMRLMAAEFADKIDGVIRLTNVHSVRSKYNNLEE